MKDAVTSKYLVLLNIGLGFWLFYGTITRACSQMCWGRMFSICCGANSLWFWMLHGIKRSMYRKVVVFGLSICSPNNFIAQINMGKITKVMGNVDIACQESSTWKILVWIFRIIVWGGWLLWVAETSFSATNGFRH